MEMENEYLIHDREVGVEFHPSQNDQLIEYVEMPIFDPQERIHRADTNVTEITTEMDPKEILEECENYEQVDDLQHLIYIRSKTSLEKRIQNNIKTEFISDCVEKTQIRNNGLLHKIQSLKEEEEQLNVLKVIEKTHYNCIQQELINIKKATDIFNGQIELAKQFETNLQTNLKSYQDSFIASSSKIEELKSALGKFNLVDQDINIAENIFKETQSAIEQINKDHNSFILIYNEKYKKLLDDITEKELFREHLKTKNCERIALMTKKIGELENIKYNIELMKEKCLEISNNYKITQSVNSEVLLNMKNFNYDTEMGLKDMSENEANLGKNIELSIQNNDKLSIENNILLKENNEFCEFNNILQARILENNREMEVLKGQESLKLNMDRDIDNVYTEIYNTQKHIEMLNNEQREQESCLHITHSQLQEMKVKLIDLIESIANLTENYKNVLEFRNTLMKKLDDQKKTLENMRIDDYTKIQIMEIESFKDWKENHKSTITKNNMEFETQKQQLHHSMDELKRQIPKTESKKQELETYNETLKTENTYIQTQLDNILEKKKCLQDKLSKAINLKDSLSFKYQLLQEEAADLQIMDQTFKPQSILKSTKFIMPTTPTKNVTFRPTVSCETLSDSSVDSFFDNIMVKSNEEKNESEFDRLLRSTSSNIRKRRF